MDDPKFSPSPAGEENVPLVRSGGAEARARDALEERSVLVGLARSVVRHSGEAEDIVDECLLRLEQQPPGVVRNVGGWLHTAVLRLAVDRARAWVRQQEHLTRYRSAQAVVEPPNEALEREELREAVWARVLELPERQRDVVILHDMRGLPYDEVARVLEIEAGTARAHAYAAREQLRRALVAWRDGGGKG